MTEEHKVEPYDAEPTPVAQAILDQIDREFAALPKFCPGDPTTDPRLSLMFGTLVVKFDAFNDRVPHYKPMNWLNAERLRLAYAIIDAKKRVEDLRKQDAIMAHLQRTNRDDHKTKRVVRQVLADAKRYEDGFFDVAKIF